MYTEDPYLFERTIQLSRTTKTQYSLDRQTSEILGSLSGNVGRYAFLPG